MEQENSRYDVLGNTFRGGPSHRLTMKNDPETVRHGAGIYSAGGRNASNRGSRACPLGGLVAADLSLVLLTRHTFSQKSSDQRKRR